MIDADFLAKTWLLLPSITLGDGSVKTNQIPTLLNSLFVTGGVFPNDNPLTRVYAGHLVPGFDAKYGPGIVVRVGAGTAAGTSGGSSHPEIPIMSTRMQMTTWAGINQYGIARRLYRAAFDWINRANSVALGLDSDGNNMFVMSCLETVEGQDVDDVGFATCISFWSLMLREG